jgi:hypothetical protein
VELQLHHSLPQHQMHESGQVYATDSLLPVSTVQSVGCAPEPVCTLWRRKKSLEQQRFEPRFLCRPALTLVAIPTELFRFSVVYLSAFIWRNWEKLRQASVRVPGHLTEMRTKNFLNWNQKCELFARDIRLERLRIISKWHSNTKWLKFFLVGWTATTVSSVGWDLRFWPYGYEDFVTWGVTPEARVASIFCSEHGHSMFLPSVGKHISIHTALHPRTQRSSQKLWCLWSFTND